MDFDFAAFSGGRVDFTLALFSGGRVDFSYADGWSVPPTFPGQTLRLRASNSR